MDCTDERPGSLKAEKALFKIMDDALNPSKPSADVDESAHDVFLKKAFGELLPEPDKLIIPAVAGSLLVGSQAELPANFRPKHLLSERPNPDSLVSQFVTVGKNLLRSFGIGR